jgi:hypothetical protein
MSDGKEIKLYWNSGRSDPGTRPEDLLASWWESQPLWTWVEPRPGVSEQQKPGPVTEVLLAGLPPAGLVLDEARLFLADRSVHLQGGPMGWAWFAICEKSVAAWPDGQVVEVLRKETRLIALRDWSPWPGTRPSLLDKHDKIRVVEYFDPDNGQRLQWRVVPPEDAPPAGGKANV